MPDDSIFALATPPGKSGIAVLRLSGPRSLDALRALTGHAPPSPRLTETATLRHPKTGDIIDRGLAIFFPAPKSFTGEDVVELHLHGSLAVIREVSSLLSGLGLRPAEPGEFSRRAYLNGKMDLLEAEGIADLIAAETLQQRQQALRQMRGTMSSHYDSLRERVTHCLALLEAYIDFPDEEIPESVLDQLKDAIAQLSALIESSLKDGKRGERLRDGVHIVILGAPNTGKSSLLNVLAGRDAAIVSARAGTTRDALEIHLDIGGFPAILVDTAGLRDSDDDIEAEGIRRAHARAEAADIRLVLFDGADWPKADKASLALVDAHSIAVASKSDLIKKQSGGTLPQPFFVSAKTGDGIDALLKELERRISTLFSSGEAPFITRERHRLLLTEALDRLEAAAKEAPLELRCEELRLAARELGKITGRIRVDDVLDVVFKSFCIGK